MTNDEKLKAFAQQVIYRMTGKFMADDSINGEEGTQFIKELVTATTLFVDELETEADWNYVTQLNVNLGTVLNQTQQFDLPTGARKLVVKEHRPVYILQDGTPVSTWDVVNPSMITTTRSGWPLRERVTYANRKLVFSRRLTDGEVGGIVVGDIVHKMPALTLDDTTLLDLVEPRQLLVTGVAKNTTLPDFVRGDISPSLAQEYADLLERCVAENNATADSNYAERDDYGHIGGIY